MRHLSGLVGLTTCLVWFSMGTVPSDLEAAPRMVAQEPSEQTPASDEEGAERGRRGREEEPGIQPYEKVITAKAKTDEGIFTVHRIEDKLYYEIPPPELDREFLLVTRIARTTAGVGYGGQKVGTRVVRWERHGDRILLRSVSYSTVADKNLPIYRAVRAANNDSIIRAFPIRAEGPGGAPVIEVTSLFTTDVIELSAKARLRARGMDRSRSFVEQALSFPENIEVRATHTYTRPPASPGSREPEDPSPRSRFFGRGMDPGSASVVMHYSMVKLPEQLMRPRLYDPRVGYFSVSQFDYGRDEHRAQERRYITRWRLEKKNPDAALSEPVEPIVYWIDPATPPKWIPYMKKGVEDWQPAFEDAGFSKAILAREAPTPEEDPEWHAEDARYSVIRWLPSTIQNASGPHVHDPRTGEILEADIQFYHNIQNLLRSWYFIQVGPLDPQAQTFPFPDELMGELLRYVVAHEVGHTLGFQHNMKASSMYTLEQVRDPSWVKKMGHVATLMDYSRFNYVAQPEDGIPAEDLFPKVGPYDRWATMWGYQPIPGAATADEEKPTLDRWARVQDETPWLRFSTRDAAGSDPGALTEAVGDADAIEATRLGLKNLERVAALLLPAASKEGEDWDDLEELYGAMLGQWVREMGHVAALVGGFYSQQKHAGQEGVRFQPVPRDRQAEAVQFLNRRAFQTPQFMIQAEILRRIEPVGMLERLRSAQSRVLRSLLSDSRMTRLVEQEALDGEKAYAPTHFLEDLREGIWSELAAGEVKVDAYRRQLQRAYLGILDSQLNGTSPVSDDARALFRAELRAVDDAAGQALDRSSDRLTHSHLLDVRDQIEAILDPKFQRRSSTPTSSFSRRGVDDWHPVDPWIEEASESCWPELIIRPESR